MSKIVKIIKNSTKTFNNDITSKNSFELNNKEIESNNPFNLSNDNYKPINNENVIANKSRLKILLFYGNFPLIVVQPKCKY